MKVIVIGAAGKTGRAVVEQAVAAGHLVTAFVHHATEYTAPANVRVVEGDATDRAAIDAAVAGHDAVLDTIGGKTPCKTSKRAQLVPSLRPCCSTGCVGSWLPPCWAKARAWPTP